MTELPKRRHPRLKNYDYSENGLYFLTICVKDREKLFGTVVGRDVLDAPKTELSEIGKIVEKYIKSINNVPKVSVENYVIMPNHIQILIFIEGETGGARSRLSPRSVLLLRRGVHRTPAPPPYAE